MAPVTVPRARTTKKMVVPKTKAEAKRRPPKKKMKVDPLLTIPAELAEVLRSLSPSWDSRNRVQPPKEDKAREGSEETGRGKRATRGRKR